MDASSQPALHAVAFPTLDERQIAALERCAAASVRRYPDGHTRSGSVKRVASAVGEGAMAVQFVHEYFKEM